jgi:hypothetical protein
LKEKLSKFTLRINADLLKKFRDIAEYNGRSANQELIMLIKKRIKQFEKQNKEVK